MKKGFTLIECLAVIALIVTPCIFQSATNSDLKCKDCTLEEQTILNVIRENSTIKQEKIAQIIGKSLRTVKTRMIEMQEKGLISRKKGKRNGEWEIL